MPPAVYVHEVKALVHGFQRHHDVVGIAGVGIERDERTHTADLEIGVDLVSLLDDKSGSH